MKIRLGYVGLSNTLNLTSSKTVTYTNFKKNSENLLIIDNIIKENLNNLKNILIYNIKNNIHFFRLSSNLIPLATKDDVFFNYIKPYKKYYLELSNLINQFNLRIDVHPNQFTVLNSTKKEIVKNSFNSLEYHFKILDALKIKDKIIIIHVGSSVLGKNNSIKRFINNFNKLPEHIKKCIALENDDKIFNIDDILFICNKLNIPCVLDYHHHICNHINDIDFNKVFATWKNLTPKIHFSSPKNNTKKDFRSHNDYINSDDFINFINKIKSLNYNIDIMLEAKKKDEALFRLIRELKYKTDYIFLDDTSFNVI